MFTDIGHKDDGICNFIFPLFFPVDYLHMWEI